MAMTVAPRPASRWRSWMELREDLADLGFSLGGLLLMLQKSLQDCLSFDPFSFKQDGLTASGEDVSRCQVAKPSW
jgi:hypothetical protein